MSQQSTFKDYQREGRLFTQRVLYAALAVTLLIFLNMGRMYQLQVLEHEIHRTESRENQVQLRPLPPKRGLIYDRNGVVLANNRLNYSLEISPDRVKNKDLEQTIAKLSKIVTITEKDRALFRKLRRQYRRFDSVPIRLSLNDEELARFAVNNHLFPGVDINANVVREYPLKELTGHVVGYVGRISEKDLENIDDAEYSGSTHIGKSGLEQSYEKELHGSVGVQREEVNAAGRPLRVLDRELPTSGRDLHLYLNLRIQEIATEAFGELNGSVVAIEVKTGGVIAMVSKPGFDPNPFVDGISQDAYDRLLKSKDRPLYNRALQGQYPPGSTVKPFVGLSGLLSGTTTFGSRTYCKGYFTLPGKSRHYRCWKKSGHGSLNMLEGIKRSCDVFFYTLASKMGIDKFHHWMSMFGFGKKTGIDLEGERSGVLPSREWKRRTMGEIWYPGETVNAGIGQGYFLVTPLQLANAVATMAAAGLRREPRLVAYARRDEEKDKSVTRPAKTYKVEGISSGNHYKNVVYAMTQVVEGTGGTARRIQNDYYHIAGKTGTAQVFSLKGGSYREKDVPLHLRDHALFIAFAPADDPRIAVAVIAENAGHGGSVAAPIAKQIMDAYLIPDAELVGPPAPEKKQ